MKELNLNQMENTHGGKFWGRHDFNCKTTSIGTWCCYDYAAFWININHDCCWAHLC
ncbi:MAG: hypothetical protein MI739_08810 [Bacteroidales bacterium]|nr:hypothetical protein [Bacteroidales bacterium]